jgi:hypothetical protein
MAMDLPSLTNPDGATVHLEPGDTLEYDFGVDADGDPLGSGNPWLVLVPASAPAPPKTPAKVLQPDADPAASGGTTTAP